MGRSVPLSLAGRSGPPEEAEGQGEGEAQAENDPGAAPLTLIFDSECSICSAGSCWIAAKTGDEKMTALPGQDEAVLAASGLTSEQAQASLWLIDGSGRRYAGAAALNRAVAELGGHWARLAALYEIPAIRSLEDLGYRWFARYHRRFAGAWTRLVERARLQGHSAVC